MTASERILAALTGLLSHFASLSALAWALNLVLTVAAVGLAVGAGRLARRIARVGAHRLPSPADAEMTVRANRLARLAGRIVQALAGLAAILVVADIWGFNLLTWTATPLGARILAGVIRPGLLLGLKLGNSLPGATRFSRQEAIPVATRLARWRMETFELELRRGLWRS